MVAEVCAMAMVGDGGGGPAEADTGAAVLGVAESGATVEAESGRCEAAETG